jgi:hypothetical protein
MSKNTETTKDQFYNISLLTLFSQTVTTFADIHALTYDYVGDNLLIKGLIQIELFVQFIEMIFYIWLVFSFSSATYITEKRYYDWVFTTPAMLFIFIVYLDFLKNNNRVYEINDQSATSYDYIINAFTKHSHTFTYVVLLNLSMLFSGYLGETKVIDRPTALLCGFLPFIAYFYIIFQNYAKYTSTGFIMWILFVIIWSLYGLASILPYTWKNISYNLLDIVSKNFFGLYLAYIASINTSNKYLQ